MVTISEPIFSSRNAGTAILRAPTLHQTTLGEYLASHSEEPTGLKISWDFFHSTANIGQFLLVKTRRFRIFSFSALNLSFAILPKILCFYAAMTTVFLTKLSGTFFFHDAYSSKGLQTNTL
jgi:hypothetical protein